MGVKSFQVKIKQMGVFLLINYRPVRVRAGNKIHQGGGGTSDCVGLGICMDKSVSYWLG